MIKSSAGSSHIGSLNEKPLHAALKEWCATRRSKTEVPVDGFFVDVVRGKVLVEIQTKNLGSIRRKLEQLTVDHKVLLVHPIAKEKWIVRLSKDKKGREVQKRRKSPKRGRFDDVFLELVSIPKLFENPNFSMQIVLIREEEIRVHDPKRAWRRKGWVTQERRLIDVVDHVTLATPADVAGMLPAGLPEEFTTADLAAASGRPRWLTQKMAYCLREMGVIERIGFRNRGILYRRLEPSSQLKQRSRKLRRSA